MEIQIAGAALLAFALVNTQTDIYQCYNKENTPLFTDRGCLNGPKLILSPTNVITPNAKPSISAPLNPIDPPDLTKKSSAAGSVFQARKQACVEAKQGLEDLRERRRRGYRLNETRSLNQREQALVKQRRKNC
ncbi:MAG: hypothetical protein AAF541_10805 [Pseudomonadota bacterium]